MAATDEHTILPPPDFVAPKPNVLIVVAPYYRAIADDLIAGAKAMLDRAGAVHDLVEVPGALEVPTRSEEHTSELQSRETISYAVFCLKKKTKNIIL